MCIFSCFNIYLGPSFLLPNLDFEWDRTERKSPPTYPISIFRMLWDKKKSSVRIGSFSPYHKSRVKSIQFKALCEWENCKCAADSLLWRAKKNLGLKSTRTRLLLISEKYFPNPADNDFTEHAKVKWIPQLEPLSRTSMGTLRDWSVWFPWTDERKKGLLSVSSEKTGREWEWSNKACVRVYITCENVVFNSA